MIDYEKIMKLNRIFSKSSKELLLEDLKHLPEHKTMIEHHLKLKGDEQ